MDYKERYEMALEGIQEILGSGEDSIKMSRLQLRLQGIFPELKEFKECDDEKIRKSIIEFVKQNKSFHYLLGVSKEDAVAWLEKQGEQKPAEWSKEDERNFDVIYGIIYNSCNAEDASRLIEWLKSLKDRVQPQPMQEWSKEAENNILFLTSIIEECFKDKEKITLCGDTVCANFTKENVIDRLKSLRPQSNWKPSKEQIMALRWVLNNVPYNGYKEEISGLLEQIKDL